MKKMTIQQKLIGMTVVLALMLAGLSIFFVERFGAVSSTYQRIPEERVPQIQVANEMSETLLRARINLNELSGVQRSLENQESYTSSVQSRFKEFGRVEPGPYERS